MMYKMDMPGLLTIPTCVLCFISSGLLADVFVRDDIITNPDKGRFSICLNHSCDTVVTQSLSETEWSQIQEIFNQPATSARQERDKIALAIAILEQLVGIKTDTSGDKGKTLTGLLSDGQMDCIDESTNTTSYLRLLISNGLIRWHSVEDRRSRYPSLFSWPHTTAVIRDMQSKRLYAVDSWFYDNGQPPVIIPLDVWKAGWDTDND